MKTKLLKYKKIIFFTTNRSDFDYQRDIILKLQKNFRCYLVCSGQHFSKKHGYSFQKIKETKIKNLIISKNIDNFHLAIKNIIKKKKPDFCCVFGDRKEMLYITLAVHSFNLPILHFCGGELTLGSKDDFYRHCITKLSDFHIVTSSEHKKRVIQMGEVPSNVFDVGSLTTERIKNIRKQKKEIIEKKLNLSFNKKNYLVTLHPDKVNNFNNYRTFFNSLKNIKNANFYITSANQDYGGEEIYKITKKIIKNENFFYLKNLGLKNYINLAFHMTAIIGNSSSGISEIPTIRIPTINVGQRQKGRPQSRSIINCDYDKLEILSAIKLVNSKKFIKSLTKAQNPFYKKDSLSRTYNIIKKLVKLKKKDKIFFNINY